MRKSLLIIITILTFALSALLGYLNASGADHGNPIKVSLSGASSSSVEQKNLLLIQVDQLGEKPVLRAVWTAVYFHSPNQTVLTLTPVFPPGDKKPELNNLADTFALNPDGSPDRAFVRRVAVKNMQYQGYLIVDDAGYAQIDEWLRSQGMPIFTPPPSNQTALFDAGCSFLHISTISGTALPDFDWKSFSSHLHSDLANNELLTDWKGLVGGGHPVNCEVLEP